MTAQVRISGWLTPEDHARAVALLPGVKTVLSIAAEVSAASGISIDRILSRGRTDHAAIRARWLVWSIAHREGISLPAIGRVTGHDHSSVLHGIRRDAEEREDEAKITSIGII